MHIVKRDIWWFIWKTCWKCLSSQDIKVDSAWATSCLSHVIISLSQIPSKWSEGCIYLFSADECEQVFLRDSAPTSQDIDRCFTFSACIFCFDVVRKSCDCLILLRLSRRLVAVRLMLQGAAWARYAQRDIFVNMRWVCFMCLSRSLVLAVLQCTQNYKTYCWNIQPVFSCFTHSILSLLTRLWLDDIFNLFVQRSLAYWGKEKKRDEWEERWAVIETHLCQAVSDVLQ